MSRLSGLVVVFCLSLATAPLCGPSAALAGSFTVDQWDLSVSVYQYPELLGDSYMTVSNPFSASHQITLPSNPATRAAAQYDISWLMDYATFNISAQQTAQASATTMARTGTSGRIYVTTTESMLLHIDASWTYSLPVDYMTATLLVNVYDPVNHVDIFGQHLDAGTFPGEPSFGTLAIEGDVTLPPGPTWVLRYDLNLHAYSGTQGHSATGSGFVDFQITPEPASLALLSPLLLAFHCHATHHRRARSA